MLGMLEFMLKPELPPSWINNAVFYQIFPDRFAKSARLQNVSHLEPWDSLPTPHGYKGGDLYGVAEQIPYLLALGINAIYLCPIFRSASNHRYHTHDYFCVDEMLGGQAAFDFLLKTAHAHGIKIVLDGVFNHASRGFFQFHDLLENGAQSPFKDWFTVYDHPLNAYDGTPNYLCWYDNPALPKFNTANPEVRERVGSVCAALLSASAERRLFVDPQCKELIKDLEQVAWKRDSHGNTLYDLDDKDSKRTHASDALGYLVHREMGRVRFGPQA